MIFSLFYINYSTKNINSYLICNMNYLESLHTYSLCVNNVNLKCNITIISFQLFK